jgi:hypothetical protein
MNPRPEQFFSVFGTAQRSVATPGNFLNRKWTLTVFIQERPVSVSKASSRTIGRLIWHKNFADLSARVTMASVLLYAERLDFKEKLSQP